MQQKYVFLYKSLPNLFILCYNYSVTVWGVLAVIRSALPEIGYKKFVGRFA
jgi:hypothetical protein